MMKTSSWIAMLAVCLTGCASEVEVEPQNGSDAQQGVYTLKGEGPLLRFERRQYPNPERVTEMVVTVLPSGQLEGLCQGASGAVSCSDTPFFVKVEALSAEEGKFSVFDLYGELIEEYVGPRAKDKQKEEGAATPPAEGPVCAAEKTAFCDKVNARLKLRNINYQVDCANVPNHFQVPSWPTSLTEESQNVAEEEPQINCFKLLGATPTFMDTEECSSELFVYSQNIRIQLGQEGVCVVSPLVLDLDGNGIQLSSLKEGVTFDLLGAGEPVQAAWTQGGDALLALDRNGNGRIDDARELFGNVTAGQRYEDGFAALAQLDADANHRIDARDPAFSSLRLWTDLNRDGKSQAHELQSLSKAKIQSLHLQPTRLDEAKAADSHGNQIPLISHFVRTNGEKGTMVDAFLRFRPLEVGQTVSHVSR